MFQLEFTDTADAQKKAIEIGSDAGLWKQIKKTLGYLQTNPRHPSLETHPYFSIPNPINTREKVFEAYAQNNTPAAYRVFFIYGSVLKPPTQGRIITIIAIVSHP
jgi:hypothetical protein